MGVTQGMIDAYMIRRHWPMMLHVMPSRMHPNLTLVCLLLLRHCCCSPQEQNANANGTALIMATANNQIEAAKALIKAGANLNAVRSKVYMCRISIIVAAYPPLMTLALKYLWTRVH